MNKTKLHLSICSIFASSRLPQQNGPAARAGKRWIPIAVPTQEKQNAVHEGPVLTEEVQNKLKELISWDAQRLERKDRDAINFRPMAAWVLASSALPRANVTAP